MFKTGGRRHWCKDIDHARQLFTTGVALWVVYRVLKSELVIIIANTVSLALLFGIFYFKLRARYRLTRLLRR